MNSKNSSWAVWIFFLVTCITSFGVSQLAGNYANVDQLGVSYWLVFGLSYSPSIFGVIMIGLTMGKSGFIDVARRLLPPLKHWPWIRFCLLFPLLLVIATAMVLGGYSVEVYNSSGDIVRRMQVTQICKIYFATAFFQCFQAGFGEELGWRGFALDRLQKIYSPFVATVVVSAVWAFWHFPNRCVFYGWGSTELAIYTLLVFAYGFILTVVYNRTNRNLFAVILLHATINSSGDIGGSFSYPFEIDSLNRILMAAIPFLISAVGVWIACGRKSKIETEAPNDEVLTSSNRNPSETD